MSGVRLTPQDPGFPDLVAIRARDGDHLVAEMSGVVMRDEVKIDAVVAVADLVARSGAAAFEVGYRNDENDPEFADAGAQWSSSSSHHNA